MTTIDFHAGSSDPGTRFELHSGLSGPAASALHLVRAAIRDGTIEGTANPAELAATDVPGSVLREVLEPMLENDPFLPGQLVRNSPLLRSAKELLDVIDQRAVYSLSAFEA